MGVSEQATVNAQDSLDPGDRLGTAVESLLLATEKLKRDYGGVIERD